MRELGSGRKGHNQMDRPDLAMHEWEAWKRLTKALQKSGAVTQADCESPINIRLTPGQEIFCLIREWGDLLVALRGGKP